MRLDITVESTRKKKFIQALSGENLEERVLERLGLDEKNIIK